MQENKIQDLLEKVVKKTNDLLRKTANNIK